MYRTLVSILVLFCLTARADEVSVERECVVLLHGLWRSELSMLPVARDLDQAGYTVANITYPSIRYSIPDLAEQAVSEGLQECREALASRIHFVTHSLGGILVRQYLAQKTIPELGRVVMLSPPNQGSQLADYVHSIRFLRWLEPEAVVQLGTGVSSVPLQLGPVDFELGVIAGRKDGWLGWPGAPDEPGDGTVAVDEARVEGMVDFLELPASHTFIMWNREVQAQVIFFLQNGRFEVPAREDAAASTVPSARAS
jgi:triacylglycerol lipase